MRHLARVVPAIVLALSFPSAALAQKRPLNTDDIYNLREVRDPQRSPDGKWVAYTVARAIKDTDKNDSDVWMVSWDGSQDIQLTSTAETMNRPASPASESALNNAQTVNQTSTNNQVGMAAGPLTMSPTNHRPLLPVEAL